MDCSAIDCVLSDVRSERMRQIAKGYDTTHDDEHGDGSLLHAAILAACEVAGLEIAGVDPVSVDGPWPDQFLIHMRDKYAENPRQKLVIAAALIVAEIERMQRVDDTEPLTVEFIAKNWHPTPLEGSPQWWWINDRVFLCCDDMGFWTACTPDSDPASWHPFASLMTVGDLRQLCALLGVKLKGGA